MRCPVNYKRWRTANAAKPSVIKRRRKQQNQRYKTDPVYREKILAKAAKQRSKTREKTRAYLAEYRKTHRAEKNARHAQKLKDDPAYALEVRCRRRLAHAMKGQPGRRSVRYRELLGCAPQELRAHIEAAFLKGMSWDNRHEWHVDHRRPVAEFDLTDLAQLKECFHFSNLQPLWKLDNLKKGRKTA